MSRIFGVCLILLLFSPIAKGEPNSCTYKRPKVGIVQGVVLDVRKFPIKDTIIRLWRDGYHKNLISEGKTDEKGRFRLPKVVPGSYYLEFQAPGYHDSQAELKVSKFSSSDGGLLISPSFSGMACGVVFEKRRLSQAERLPEE